MQVSVRSISPDSHTGFRRLAPCLLQRHKESSARSASQRFSEVFGGPSHLSSRTCKVRGPLDRHHVGCALRMGPSMSCLLSWSSVPEDYTTEVRRASHLARP